MTRRSNTPSASPDARKTARFRVGVATTSRADFGIYRPVLAALAQQPGIELGLIVSGMHLSPEFGMTVHEVEASGVPVFAQFECLVSSDSAAGVGASMGLATLSAAQAFMHTPLDLLVVLGDRYEMHAIALAALPHAFPVAHIHAGEETLGAIDNALRHSMTKLSHLQFCATEEAAARVRAMGENPDNVVVSGAPSLDNVLQTTLLDRAQLKDRFAIPADRDYVLVTYHPVTLDLGRSHDELEAVLAALAQRQEHAVMTLANADPSGRAINRHLKKLSGEHAGRITLVGHFGTQGYFSAMQHARMMIGNSSSGIIEAASFGLPVINVGDRQKGRERSPNVIDAEGDTDAILAAIEQALTPGHQQLCAMKTNVYGDGQAARRIAETIIDRLTNGLPVQKPFFDGTPHD